MNRNPKKPWVDPNGHALEFLNKYKSGEKTDEASQQAPQERETTTLAVVRQPEILPPEPAMKLPQIRMPQLPVLPATPDLNKLIKETLETLDLDKPEGFLDFRRREDRLGTKTEYGRGLLQLRDVMLQNLQQVRRLAEESTALDQVHYEAYIEKIQAAHRALTAQYQLECAAADVRRQETIKDAKARAEIAECERRIRDREREPLPPPPPQPPVDPLEETRRKRREEHELHLQELEEKATAGQEMVTRAKSEAVKIYQNLLMTSGEKRVRIRQVLDTYNFSESILPPAIQELMEDDNPDDNI